jgi:hypothetical protein
MKEKTADKSSNLAERWAKTTFKPRMMLDGFPAL